MITNVSIRTLTPGLIDFFYPNFIRCKEFSPWLDHGVIFDGDSSYLQKFRDNNIPYIYIIGTPEYDLTIAENLMNFVYLKWNKKPTKAILEYISTMKYDDRHKRDIDIINNIAKQVWITGKSSVDEIKTNDLKEFIKGIPRTSKLELIKLFYKAVNESSFENINYRLLTFMGDVNTVYEDNKNVYYAESLKNFKSGRGKNIKKAIYEMLYSEIDNDELKIINLLIILTSVNRN